MDSALCSLAHALSRTAWMRETDLAERRGLGADVLGAREEWRVQREDGIFTELQRVCRAVEDAAKRGGGAMRESPQVAAVADEALGVSLGMTAAALGSHPAREFAPVLFDPAQPHAKSFAAADASRAAEQAAVVEAILAQVPASDAAALNRPALHKFANVFLVACALWQRFTETVVVAQRSAEPISLTLVLQKVVARQRAKWLTGFDALRMHGMITKSPQKEKDAHRAKAHHPNPPVRAAGHAAAAAAPPRPQQQQQQQQQVLASSPSLEYWERVEAGFSVDADVRAQCDRRWLKAEREGRRLSFVRDRLRYVAAVRKRRRAEHESSAAMARGMLDALAAQQPALGQYASLVFFLQNEDRRAADFFEREERDFNRQFRGYVQRMTQFYLHECPLDQGWIARYDGEAGADSGERRVLYINTATGRSQEEHPNMLKVVAAKNRQLLKANAARQQRHATMQRHIDSVNALRRNELPKFDELLGQRLL